jgi:hypothetical protein
MWRLVTWLLSDVSKERIAFIFNGQAVKFCLTLEDDNNKLFRNVEINSPNVTVSHTVRHEPTLHRGWFPDHLVANIIDKYKKSNLFLINFPGCYTPKLQSRAIVPSFTSRNCVNMLEDLIFCNTAMRNGRTMALTSTQPPTEMSTRNNSWAVKAAGA